MREVHTWKLAKQVRANRPPRPGVWRAFQKFLDRVWQHILAGGKEVNRRAQKPDAGQWPEYRKPKT
jgi:hypothetical protein